MRLNRRRKSYRDLCKDLAKGSPLVIELANATFEQFCKDPADPSLRLHKLEARPRLPRYVCWSVSVSMRYRAIYFIDGDVNVWFWIGSHEAYNNLIA